MSVFTLCSYKEQFNKLNSAKREIESLEAAIRTLKSNMHLQFERWSAARQQVQPDTEVAQSVAEAAQSVMEVAQPAAPSVPAIPQVGDSAIDGDIQAFYKLKQELLATQHSWMSPTEHCHEQRKSCGVKLPSSSAVKD